MLRARSGAVSLMSVLTLLFFLLAAFLGGRTLLRQANGDEPRAKRLPAVEGASIDSLAALAPDVAAWLDSRSGVRSRFLVYVFQTTCQACSFQKAHMDSLLQGLYPGAYVTLSTEPSEVTKEYWPAPLSRALHAPQSALTRIGLRGVPSLLLVDGDGTVAEAWMGVITSWSADDLLRKLET